MVSWHGILTPEEETLKELFTVDLTTTILAMRYQQVFCEGHNSRMQEYVFQQIDNSKGFNFVEMLLKLFKNEL